MLSSQAHKYREEKEKNQESRQPEGESGEIGLEHKPVTVSECCAKHFFIETGKTMMSGRLLVECINCWAGDHYDPNTHCLHEGQIKEIDG